LDTFKSFDSLLYSVNDRSFQNIAISLFQYQATHNPIYNQYIQNLSIDVKKVDSLDKIPYLPISFFKSKIIKTGKWTNETCYSSSGTTAMETSKHYLPNVKFYLDHAEKCFSYFFGDLTNYHFLAFLPSYLERSNSSLIAMMDSFITKSRSSYSGFYLHDIDKLLTDLNILRKQQKKVILWGVSFALLELVEKYQPDLSHCLVFETGGMKGRRKEITRHELHTVLQKGLNVECIYSEYGMTELLSQAYAKGSFFECPPYMKVMARDITDPFKIGLVEEMGALNVIDLANHHSVAFIETEDIGKVLPNGCFEVLGRLDNSDIRGCNLLIE
jgi:hypothetical protein